MAAAHATSTGKQQVSTGSGSVGQHQPSLRLGGRGALQLVYVLVATLVAAPHCKAVGIIDLDGSFDATRLLLPFPRGAVGGGDEDGEGEAGVRGITLTDLRHVHVIRPPRPAPASFLPAAVSTAGAGGPVAATTTTMTLSQILSRALSTLDMHMVYGGISGANLSSASAGREWWGTIVIGGVGGSSGTTIPEGLFTTAAGAEHAARIDVVASWRGWLHVEAVEPWDGRYISAGGMTATRATGDADALNRSAAGAEATAARNLASAVALSARLGRGRVRVEEAVAARIPVEELAADNAAAGGDDSQLLAGRTGRRSWRRRWWRAESRWGSFDFADEVGGGFL